MNLAYITRGDLRIKAHHLGNGLLRPLKTNGHNVVAAAREAEIHRALTPTPAPKQEETKVSEYPAPVPVLYRTVTVVHREGYSPLVRGGNADNRKYWSARSHNAVIDTEIYDCRDYSSRSWKTYRIKQYQRRTRASWV